MDKNKWIEEKVSYFRKNYTLGEFAEPAYIVDFIEQSLEEAWDKSAQEEYLRCTKSFLENLG